MGGKGATKELKKVLPLGRPNKNGADRSDLLEENVHLTENFAKLKSTLETQSGHEPLKVSEALREFSQRVNQT